MVRERGFWLMLLGLLFIAAPLTRPGLPPTDDGTIHAFRVLEMYRLWGEGIFYPRWAPDLAFGLGVPLFHFLGPLFPWLAAAGMALGAPLELSLKISLAGLLLLGSTGVYGMARQWGLSQRAALIAGLAFAGAPFRVRELYWQGDFPQYLALSVLPWALLALHQALRRPRWGRCFAAAVAVALLPLSHNITALLSAPILISYGFGVILAERLPWHRIRAGLLIAGIAAGLSAFFVLPALMDRPLVHLDRLTQGEYDFRKHFLDLRTLLALPPLYDDRLGNRRLILTLGLHQLGLALPAIGWGGWIRQGPGGRRADAGRRRLLALGCGVGLSVMILMMLPPSRGIWELIPGLAYAEFPWRWLGPAALPLALLIGLGVDSMPSRVQGLWTLAAFGILILGVLGLLYNGGTSVRLLNPDIPDLHAFERRHRYPGLVSVGELFPKWVEGEIEGSPLEAAYRTGEEPARLDWSSLPPGSEGRSIERKALDQRYMVHLPVGGSARFYVLAFPGWTVRVDGRPVPTWAEARTGWLRAEIPAGTHEIRLRFEPLLGWRLLEWFSGILAIACLGRASLRFSWKAIQLPRLRGIVPSPAHLAQHLRLDWREWPTTERILLGVGGIALIIQAPYRLWTAMRVPLDQPAGAIARPQVDYDGRIRLVGYRLEPAVVGPGARVRLTLWWRPLQVMEAQYSVYVHVYPAVGEPHIAFQSDHMHPADVPTDAWDTERMYQDVHLLRVPEGIEPGLYRIRVGLYERLNPSNRLRIEGSGEDGFELPLSLVVTRTISSLPQSVVFGGKIRLIGIEAPSEWRIGVPWKVWLAFEALGRLDRDYTLFVHVLDETGRTVGQQDLWQPTSRWPVEVAVPVAVPLDGLPSPGRYLLRIGWYAWPEMAHLLPDAPSPEGPFYSYPVPIIGR